MSNRLAWGILATGSIAGTFAKGVAKSEHGRLAAVGSRSQASAARFAAEFGVPVAHASYAALLADPAVQAVYIATPHPQHCEWAIRAAQAGKHILCEKPLGLNHAEAMVMAEAARANGVLLMEAFMYRCHPQTEKIVELVRSGALGTVKLVQAAFGFYTDPAAGRRLWDNAAGGGGILDVGCYPVSFARLIAGASSALPFLNPASVSGNARLHPATGVDDTAAASLQFANGMIAQVSCSIGLQQDNSARIYGTKAMLHIPQPWVPPAEGAATTMFLHAAGSVQEIGCTTPGNLYGLEADAVALALAAGQREVAAVTVADTLGNLAALDAWRNAAGLVYAQETPEQFTHTHARRALRRQPDAVIPHGTIAGLAKPVSRLVMGCDNQTSMPHAAAIWDDFFERGGNAFDTANIYAGGLQERLLGQWLHNRGIRETVTVIAKGAHTPLCTPEWASRQLEESLDRLQTSYADIYLLHRDNLAVPVGEFVDVLNMHARAGRMHIFGGSNWSIERISAANRYAKRKGLQGFSVLSNNFSLARMVEPVWAGSISAADPASRRWLAKQQMPLLAWSSQARGFFTERAGADKLGDAELVRCWYAADNFTRRERALQLAQTKRVAPIAIAAAYVLAQPFPTFALIGPRLISETVSSLECTGVQLSARELARLNLERESI
jgi:predicted dehydrogenase/diketogulonate reductase-like aldo/keto reductase